MPFEYTAKQNYPDYTGYKCMVKNHLTLEVRNVIVISYPPSLLIDAGRP